MGTPLNPGMLPDCSEIANLTPQYRKKLGEIKCAIESANDNCTWLLNDVLSENELTLNPDAEKIHCFVGVFRSHLSTLGRLTDSLTNILLMKHSQEIGSRCYAEELMDYTARLSLGKLADIYAEADPADGIGKCFGSNGEDMRKACERAAEKIMTISGVEIKGGTDALFCFQECI